MTNAILYEKDDAVKRIEYVKNLRLTEHEYLRKIRKQMLKYHDNTNGIFNSKIPAQQELMIYENYGYTNLKHYIINMLNDNVNYCNVLECKTHDEQIELTCKYLKDSCNLDYVLDLCNFASKIEDKWYIPVDMLINWVDCYMIQRELFMNYAVGDNPLLFASHYFDENVLFLIVPTDNTNQNLNNDMNTILKRYEKIVNVICNILNDLPEDRMIDDLFNMTDEQIKENTNYINQLEEDYEKLIENNLEDE